ncbi:cytochrome-c peroxidase [Larkinella soli]|uniref:cytochrome-c peroxidase n=1 Tax=Larkinella soli TaxID=1770527 RepID=UPI000FFC0E1D|nr:cytochrome c peroxidase [Larkinella soli]
MPPARFLTVFGAATLLCLGVLVVFSKEEKPAVPPAVRVHRQFGQDVNNLEALVRNRLLPAAERSSNPDTIRTAFLECRLAYKKLEVFTEYYFKTATRLVNGPPLPEVEADEAQSFEPGGFQVIEELLYPFEPENREKLVREIRKLTRELSRLSSLWEATELTDRHVFDAMRLQVFRLMTLGITGFDTPICKNALPETAVSLGSLQVYLRYYPDTPQSDRLEQTLRYAVKDLHRHPNIDRFDRVQFIRHRLNPLTAGLLAHQKHLDIQPFSELRPLRADAATLFDAGAFDPDFYAPNARMRSSPEKVSLGKRLFSDPVLSEGKVRSCAGCHQPDRAFTDGLPRNSTLTGRGAVLRNTPTLLNTALQAALFYDLRSDNLENQSLQVVGNRDEMHGSFEEAARKLAADSRYRSEFRRAFPEILGNRIEPVHLRNALAAYERSLVRLDSPFDRFMRGQDQALTATEVRGLNLFMGKARCATCHFVPLLNGTVPPEFRQTESEVIGVPVRPGRPVLDPDPGRYAVIPLNLLRHSFKTPTLRGLARTGPYMHNGAFRTLDEVVDFYDRGGGKGLGIDLPNQTLPADPLRLSKAEKAALLAFLNVL